MSKIIKASHIKRESDQVIYQVPNISRHDHNIVKQEETQEYLSQETANKIYFETKQMMEEVLAEAKRKADEIIKNAQHKAEETLAATAKEKESLEETAYQQGFERGYQDGQEQGEKSKKDQYPQFLNLLQQLREEKEDYLKDNEKNMVELVMLIAQKVLNTVVEAKPEVIHSIVQNCVEKVMDAERITVRLNPQHIPYLSVYRDKYPDNMTIEEDQNIPYGGCMVITENGFIESSIDEQMELLRADLQEVVRNAGH